MHSPNSPPHSPTQLEELLKQSDSDSFTFPDSTVDQEECKAKVDPVQDMIKRMEANNAFSRLYRATSDGGLVQVVRRREFPPLTTTDMLKVKLTDPRCSKSPSQMENGLYSASKDGNNGFRYPYWRFLPKRKGLNGPLLRSLGNSSSRRTDFGFHKRGGSLGQQSDWERPSIILPQVKVRKRIPSVDQLGQTGKDLGIDLGDNFAERFRTFSSQVSQAKLSQTPVPSTGPVRYLKRSHGGKKFASPEASERSVSKKGYDPEDFRRERQLTEQAKALFMSGAFSKYYHKERESADKEMLGWLKYC